MTAPRFRILTKEEFSKFTLEERMAYLRELLADIQIKLEETRQQIDERNKLLSE